jgi:hypothetical protein
MFFVSVASKGLRYCASPLFATHTSGAEVLHLKDLYCTKIVHISRLLRGVDMHGADEGNKLQLYPEGTVPEEYGLVKRNQLRSGAEFVGVAGCGTC